MVLERLKDVGESPKEQSFQGFTTTMKENQVRYLFNALKERSLIASNTAEEVFFSAFQPLGYDSAKIVPEKVKWIALKKSCVYLISELLKKRNIISDSQWKTISYCIELENYNNLAKLSSASPPSNAQMIDEVIEGIPPAE